MHSVHVMHMRDGTQVLVAGLLMVATVACDAGLHYSVPDTPARHGTTAPPSTAATPASPARHSAQATDAAEAPASSPAAAPSNTRSRATTSARTTPACTSRDLAAAEGAAGAYDHDGSTWYATRIVLRNRSGSACLLSGWPGLTFFGDGTLHVCTTADPPDCRSGEHLGHPPVQGHPVQGGGPARRLPRPGSHDLVQADLAVLRCRPRPPYGVEIRLPGGSRPLTLAPTKNIIPCEQMLEVTPFGVTA